MTRLLSRALLLALVLLLLWTRMVLKRRQAMPPRFVSTDLQPVLIPLLLPSMLSCQSDAVVRAASQPLAAS